MIASGISQVADTTREKHLPELQAEIFGAGSALNIPAQSRRAVFLSSGLVRFCFYPGFFHLLSGWVVIALDFAFRPGKTVESEPCFAQDKYLHKTSAPKGGENMGRPLLRASEVRKKAETYITPAEREEIVSKAREARLSLATFLRTAALGHPIHCVPVINGERWTELARTTANLNALAAKIHSGEIAYLPEQVLDELRDQVESVRRLLLGEPG